MVTTVDLNASLTRDIDPLVLQGPALFELTCTVQSEVVY